MQLTRFYFVLSAIAAVAYCLPLQDDAAATTESNELEATTIASAATTSEDSLIFHQPIALNGQFFIPVKVMYEDSGEAATTKPEAQSDVVTTPSSTEEIPNTTPASADMPEETMQEEATTIGAMLSDSDSISNEINGESKVRQNDSKTSQNETVYLITASALRASNVDAVKANTIANDIGVVEQHTSAMADVNVVTPSILDLSLETSSTTETSSESDIIATTIEPVDDVMAEQSTLNGDEVEATTLPDSSVSEDMTEESMDVTTQSNPLDANIIEVQSLVTSKSVDATIQTVEESSTMAISNELDGSVATERSTNTQSSRNIESTTSIAKPDSEPEVPTVGSDIAKLTESNLVTESNDVNRLDVPNVIFFPTSTFSSATQLNGTSVDGTTKPYGTPVKFLAPIRRTLEFGHAVVVKGITGGLNSYGPSINLMNGNCHWNQRHDCDLILNIYVNISNGIDQVQRSYYNAMLQRYHEVETYGGAPFEPYTTFEVEIIPRTDLFEIKVNRKYFCSYTYKMPLGLTNHVLISTSGDIDFVRVDYLKKNADGVERAVGGEVLINSLEEE